MSLVSQVGRTVTYYATKVNQIDTIFTKKLSKTVKKGVPLLLPPFGGNLAVTRAPPPPPSCGPSEAVLFPWGPSPGEQNRTSSRNFEVGGPRCPQGLN